MRTDVVRGEVQRLLRQVPFEPFVLMLENDQQVSVEHPENIAFDPAADGSSNGSPDFYVIGGGLHIYSTFEAITSVGVIDTAEARPTGPKGR